MEVEQRKIDFGCNTMQLLGRTKIIHSFLKLGKSDIFRGFVLIYYSHGHGIVKYILLNYCTICPYSKYCMSIYCIWHVCKDFFSHIGQKISGKISKTLVMPIR